MNKSTNSKKYKAIIFDLDGTIVDTETLHLKFYPQAFAHSGYHLTKRMYCEMRALGRPYLTRQLKKWYKKDIELKLIARYSHNLLVDYLKDHKLKVMPGIKKVLTWLQKNKYTTAVVTGSTACAASLKIKDVNLEKYLPIVISASDVKIGKPSKYPYLHACKVLGLKPEDCLAIEDCPNGVKSAIAAGLNTVWIPNLTQPTKEERKMPVTVLSSADKLIPFIRDGIIK